MSCWAGRYGYPARYVVSAELSKKVRVCDQELLNATSTSSAHSWPRQTIEEGAVLSRLSGRPSRAGISAPRDAGGSRSFSCAISVLLAAANVLLVSLAVCRSASAAPETWFDPIQTLTGPASSEFGSALSCSSSVVGLNYSYIAVGAPYENAAEGRVYIVGPAGIVKKIEPPTLGRSGNFGYAMTFATDINGDSIEELVIGEPDADSGAGYVHVYLSTGVPSDPYAHCATRTSTQSFGSFILRTSTVILNGFQIVVSTADSATVSTFQVTYNHPSCAIESNVAYNDTGAANSRYGQSMGEIDTGAPSKVLLVGAPREASDNGRLYALAGAGGATVKHVGTSLSKAGVSVASRADSAFYALVSPGATGTNKTLHINRQTGGSYFKHCALDNPMSDLADTAAQSLAHLKDAFASFLSVTGSGATFASYRSEVETGGSVALVGANDPSSCVGLQQVNNCQPDTGQRQGQALAGGSSCVTSGGTKLLVVGSPGFSNNAGRVDVYAEGTESGTAAPCQLPTATPTQTPGTSPIVEPTPTPPGVTPIPADPQTRALPAPVVSSTGVRGVDLTAALVSTKNKKFPFVGWLFTITSKVKRSRSMGTLSVDALAVTTKKRQMFSRRNTVSLRGLKPGAYAAAYQPVFGRAKDKNARVLGKMSRSTTFTIR